MKIECQGAPCAQPCDQGRACPAPYVVKNSGNTWLHYGRRADLHLVSEQSAAAVPAEQRYRVGFDSYADLGKPAKRYAICSIFRALCYGIGYIFLAIAAVHALGLAGLLK